MIFLGVWKYQGQMRLFVCSYGHLLLSFINFFWLSLFHKTGGFPIWMTLTLIFFGPDRFLLIVNQDSVLKAIHTLTYKCFFIINCDFDLEFYHWESFYLYRKFERKKIDSLIWDLKCIFFYQRCFPANYRNQIQLTVDLLLFVGHQFS